MTVATMDIPTTLDSSIMAEDDGEPLEIDNLAQINGPHERKSEALNKFADGLKNLGGSTFADFSFSEGLDAGKSKSSTTASARAAAFAKALTAPTVAKDSSGSGAAVPDVVDNCLDFLHASAPKEASLADKLKAINERSKVALAPKAKSNTDLASETEPLENGTCQGIANEEDAKEGDNLDGSAAKNQGKRESIGKVTRGRSPPRSAIYIPGPKEQGSSLGKKVFTDLLADDGEDSDDSDMDTSNKMKAMMMGKPVRKNSDTDLSSVEESESERRKDPDKRSNLSRARSERSLSRGKSPMKRTKSDVFDSSGAPQPTNMSRAVSTGSGLERSKSPRRPVTRTRSSAEGRKQIPRRIKSSQQAIEDMAKAANPGMKRSSTYSVEAKNLNVSPSRRGLLSKAQSVRNNAEWQSRGPPRRSASGLKQSDDKELRRSLSGSKKDSDARGGSVSRSASRRNLSRTRSSRGVVKGNDDGKVDAIESLLDSKPVKRANIKRNLSGGAIGSASRASKPAIIRRNLSGGSIDSTGKPVARLSAPARSLSSRKKNDLDVKSEHVPARRRNLDDDDDNIPAKPNSLLRTNSNGSMESPVARPRRPRMGRTMSDRNVLPGRTAPIRPTLGGKADSEHSLEEDGKEPKSGKTSEPRRRRARDARTDKSGEGREKKSGEMGEESEASRRENADADDEDALRAKGGSRRAPRKRNSDRDLGRRRKEAGDEAEDDGDETEDDGDKHSRRGERRTRRPEEDGKRSTGRKQTSRNRNADEEDGGEAARSADGRRRKPRRRQAEDEKSDGDLSPDDKSPIRRTRTPTEEERSRGRRGRRGDGQSPNHSPMRGQNKVRRQSDVARNQYAGMIKYAQELEEEAEEEEKVPEEEPEEEEVQEEQEEKLSKKKGLFKSAFGAVNTAAKLGVKVAKTTGKVAKTTGKAVSDSLGVSTHHGKVKSNDYLQSDEYDKDKRALNPAPSISVLVGRGLGGSSSVLLNDNSSSCDSDDGFADDADDTEDTKKKYQNAL